MVSIYARDFRSYFICKHAYIYHISRALFQKVHLQISFGRCLFTVMLLHSRLFVAIMWWYLLLVEIVWCCEVVGLLHCCNDFGVVAAVNLRWRPVFTDRGNFLHGCREEHDFRVALGFRVGRLRDGGLDFSDKLDCFNELDLNTHIIKLNNWTTDYFYRFR